MAEQKGTTFSGVRRDPWRLRACPRVQPGGPRTSATRRALNRLTRRRSARRTKMGPRIAFCQGCSDWKAGGMYRVEMYARVRRACHVEGMSTREASRVFGVDRKTVRKMLSFSVPPGYRRGKPPRRPKLGPFTGIIDRMEDDRTSHHKQRHTGRSASSTVSGTVRVRQAATKDDVRRRSEACRWREVLRGTLSILLVIAQAMTSCDQRGGGDEAVTEEATSWQASTRPRPMVAMCGLCGGRPTFCDGRTRR